jgi:plasmid stabilization system protein ParE
MAIPSFFDGIAKSELEESIAWYEVQSAGLENRVSQLRLRLFSLELQKRRNNFREFRGEIRRAVLQRFPYTLHFVIESERIVILAVFHVKRNPRSLEDR